MSQQRTDVVLPLGPRAELLTDGRFVIRAEHESGPVLLVYDPERCAAATWHIEQRIWRIQVPVSLREYLGGLTANGYRLPEGADLQTWLAAVSGVASAGPKH